MSWNERQRAMLEAMGLKLWTPVVVEAPLIESDVAVAEAPAPPAPPAPPRVVAAPARPPIAAPAPARAVAPVTAAAAVDAALAQARGVARETIARLDWPGLRDEVAACRACSLCESRKNTVFGVGNERAHWMVVGEAPGEQEDLQGEPFVGAAGKLLDSMLRAVGLSRGEGTPERQVYIANTLKCRPPRNRNPDPSELAQCEPFLQRQIELIQPRIILAMGRFAVQQLLRSQEPIGKLRGRVHRYQGVPLVVTYHPAYLLRNLPDKARAWEDLCLALKTLEESPPRDESAAPGATPSTAGTD
ncbi:MAG: uracil-DNA glycosylase [Rubrivivax sp.]|nr:MAG: uracil-DNA glycosylase [Rubrivivax sp.]